MRMIVLVLVLLGVALPASAQDELFTKLQEDPETGRAFEKGMKILDDYFEGDADVGASGTRGVRARRKRDEALIAFKQWLATTEESLKIDLRRKHQTVLEMLDQARAGHLKDLRGVKARGDIRYVTIENAPGMTRFEYSVLLPNNYDISKFQVKVPCVISLHGRVIDPKHPAFRGNKDFAERSRQVLYNNWLDTPAADDVLVIAPTGNPNGFRFDPEGDHYDDLQMLYRTLGEALTNYRVDWDRVWVELQGQALRVACEQAFMFAGFIVRDRVDDRQRPFLPEEQLFMLENLNGTPLVYVADEDHWEKVGKPIAESLQQAYTKAGAADKLLILKGRRDANQALKADPEKIHKFVLAHTRPHARPSFTWRFFSPNMTDPVPVGITGGNFAYDFDEETRNAPLEAKAGRLSFEAKVVNEGEQGYNLIEIKVTEAQDLKIFLHEDLVDLDLPITVRVNDVVVHDKKVVQPSWDFFWTNVLPRRYFMLPYVGELTCSFEPKPEFVSKEEQGEQAGDGEGAPEEGADKPEGSDAGGDAAPGEGGDGAPEDKPK